MSVYTIAKYVKIHKRGDTARLIGDVSPLQAGCETVANTAGLVEERPLSTGGVVKPDWLWSR